MHNCEICGVIVGANEPGIDKKADHLLYFHPTDKQRRRALEDLTLYAMRVQDYVCEGNMIAASFAASELSTLAGLVKRHIDATA